MIDTIPNTKSSVGGRQTIPLDSLQASVTQEGWRRLKAYLGQVEVGTTEMLETPFFHGDVRTPEPYAEWYYRNIAHSGLAELDELEAEEIEKFSSFSIRLPYSERRDGVLEYFSSTEYPENPDLLKAFDRLVRLVPKHSVRPNALNDSYSAMPKDSNLGLPHFTRSKKLARDYLMRARAIAADGYKQAIYPAVIGWRGQSSGDPEFPKQRVVWMEDHCETIIGLAVQVPLLNKLRTHPSFVAWNSLDRIDKVVTSYLDRTKQPIMSADFSGFDKTLPGVVIHMVFELLRAWFVNSAKHQLDWLEEQLLHVGLVTPEGILVGKQAAVPSGSALTNLVDSLGQLLMVLGLVDFASVLGDDGWYTGVDDPGLLTDTLYSQYGVQVSADKGGYSQEQVRYLQRLHMRGYRVNGICVGVRSLVRSWKSVCFVERHSPGLEPEFYSARAISIMENSRWHPRFPEAIRFLYSLDKYLQELDPEEIFVRAGGAEFVEHKLGLDSFKYGKELPSQGLNNFETVRLLRMLRQGKSF